MSVAARLPSALSSCASHSIASMRRAFHPSSFNCARMSVMPQFPLQVPQLHRRHVGSLNVGKGVRDDPLTTEKKLRDDPLAADKKHRDDPFLSDKKFRDDNFGAEKKVRDDPLSTDKKPREDPFSADKKPRDDPFSSDKKNRDDAMNPEKKFRDDPLSVDKKLRDDPLSTDKKGREDPLSNDKKSSSEEVPVQSGSSYSSHAPKSEHHSNSRRPKRDWMSDDEFGFDNIFGPFRSLVPRQLRHPLKQMQRWMNRDGARLQGAEAEDQLSNTVKDMIYDFDAELLKPVSLTLEERENEYLAKMYLKGFQKSDLNLRLQDNYLIVNGSLTNEEFNDRKERGRMHSYSSQSFSRVLNLPEDVDRTNIHAKFEQNELIIKLPKDANKKHVIEIH